MKTAVLHIAVYEFTCPECQEYISNDNNGGSHLFPTSDFIPETLKCDTCKVELKTPKKALK